MRQHQEMISVHAGRPGLHDVTGRVAEIVDASEIELGICTLFVRHTSCSLLIQENADPSARYDLERYFERIAPENDPEYTHTMEGADDMPAHLRAALTQTTLQVPIRQNRLVLGTWQGIYLFEHRHAAHRRELVVHVLGE
ncbi:MAG: secondary thiamine-phosphate synthase enzyme YjbQ [Candidatus Eisenbacteria bacterium]